MYGIRNLIQIKLKKTSQSELCSKIVTIFVSVKIQNSKRSDKRTPRGRKQIRLEQDTMDERCFPYHRWYCLTANQKYTAQPK